MVTIIINGKQIMCLQQTENYFCLDTQVFVR